MSYFRFNLLFIITISFFACKESTDQQNVVDTSQNLDDLELKVNEIQAQLPAIDYDSTIWTEISRLDTHFIIDLKYATHDNFVDTPMYACARAFLRKDAADALQEAHLDFLEQGYRIKIFDVYRPRPVQQRLWNKVPNPSYVSHPSKGSMHNRGAAIDITLTDMQGRELDMGTPFDFFGKAAHTYSKNHSPEVIRNRQILRRTLRKYGYKHISTEWWHYSFQNKFYPVSDWEWPCE